MVQICVVKGCKKEAYPGSGISFHRFPVDNDLKRRWVEVLQISGNVSKYAMVCSLHFKDVDFLTEAKKRLKPDAVPSLLPNIFPDTKKIQILSTIQLVAPENTEPGCSREPPIKKIKLETQLLQKSQEKSTQTEVFANPTPATPRKTKLRRDVKILKQKLKRRDVKIENLKQLLNILKNKCTNYVELESVINVNFSNICNHLNTRKSDRGVRYSDNVKSFALTVYFYSARAYRFLRNYACLPHPSTLRRLLSTSNCNVGFISEVLNYLKIVASENDTLKNVALIFDAMSIRAELKYDLKSDKYWGYIDYGGIMSDDSETLATEVLIFQIVSYTAKFKCPIAYFFINKLGAEVQSHLIRAAIQFLNEINITVKSITCDGTVTNFKTFENLGCDFTLPNLKTSFKHPEKDCEIHCIMDPPHMVKLFRNVFAETNLSSENGRIDFKYIKQLHKIQEDEGLRLANKLSSSHVTFHNKKMNVRLATQLLSSSVADAIDFLRLCGNNEFNGSEATVE